MGLDDEIDRKWRIAVNLFKSIGKDSSLIDDVSMKIDWRNQLMPTNTVREDGEFMRFLSLLKKNLPEYMY